MNNYISVDIKKRKLKALGKKIILEQSKEFNNLTKYQIFGKYLYITSTKPFTKQIVSKYKLYSAILCDPNKQTIYKRIKNIIPKNIQYSTFAINVERKGEHKFTSTELAREVAGSVFDLFPDIKVNLDKPELKVNIKIHNNKAIIYAGKK